MYTWDYVKRNFYLPDVKVVDKEKHPLVKKYTRWYDRVINKGFKDGFVGQRSADIINDIISAINEVEVFSKEVIFFRGVKATDEFPIDTMEVGDIIDSKGFVSKTENIKVAEDFIQDLCCIIAIVYPPGSKQIYMGGTSYYPAEDEYLTYPNEKFEITDVHITNGGKIRIVMVPISLDPLMLMVDYTIDEGYYEFKRICDIYGPPFVFVERRLTITDDKSYKRLKRKYKDYIITMSDVKYYEKPDVIDDRLYTLYCLGITGPVLAGKKLTRVV